MAQTLEINNFSAPNILELSQLDADNAAGDVTLTIKNNNNIGVNDFIVIGTLGSETSEIKKVSAVSGATGLTVPALSFKHNRFEAITKLFGDQITVYRAANVNGIQPADASFAVFSGSNFSIDIDQLATNFSDSTGSSSYWYKYVYTNSVSGLSTNLADSSSARGQGYNNYASLDDIRGQAGFRNARYITDAMIDEKRQTAQQTINAMLVGLYTIPFQSPINPLVRDMTIRLAAGWLLLQQYSHVANANTVKGQDMVDSVTNKDKTGDLDKLALGNLTLTDANGNAMDIEGAGADAFNSWPDTTTASAAASDGGGARLFRISDIQGYTSRNY